MENMENVLRKIRVNVDDEDEEDLQYRSCCGRLRSTYAAGLVGFLESVAIIYFVISAMIMNNKTDEQGYWGRKVLVVVYSLIVINLIAVVVPLYLGLRWEKAWLLIFHLIKDVSFFLLSLLGAGILCVAMVTLAAGSATLHGSVPFSDGGLTPIGEAKTAFWKAKGYLIASFIVCLVYAVLQIWFFAVVLSAFKCLRAKARRRNEGAVMSDAPPPYSV